jgi:hypothetical protein
VSKERIRRPQPSRTQPIRNLSTLFGGGPRRAGGGEGGDESARDTKGVASFGEAVSRSVELGYRVVDDYIQQGQRAAQRLNDRSLAPETITRDVQELSARMAQYASDFLGVWFEMLELATAGSAARRTEKSNGDAASVSPPTPAPTPAPPRAPREPSSERTRVRIEVISTKPAEVSLDLMPDAGRASLVVHALRAVDPEKPRLADVVLERGAGGEPLTLRIRVPADQPPGVYNGLIIDEQTNRPAGTVSVRLGAG